MAIQLQSLYCQMQDTYTTYLAVQSLHPFVCRIIISICMAEYRLLFLRKLHLFYYPIYSKTGSLHCFILPY